LPAFQSTPSPRFNRTLQFALFGTSILWVFAAQQIASSASRGFAMRFDLAYEQTLLSSILFLFLVTLGFGVLQAISGRPRQLSEILGLPQRSTARQEWAIGAALGWGGVVLAVLPIAVFASLRVHFFPDSHAFFMVLINLATLLVAALAEEVAFRGYPFRRLIEAVGPVAASILSAMLFGLAHLFNPDATVISVLITMLAGLLLSIAWLRTHGLWLPWGFHFAWNASMGILFGLPVSGIDDFSTVIHTHSVGRHWITGSNYGPEAGFFTLVALVVAMVVLVRVTREYAWNYTHPPIVPGGYPVDVAPPPAHTAMEAEAQTRPTPLVQIMPTTPGTMSVQPQPTPVSEEPHFD
jgi:uncharacterized protein